MAWEYANILNYERRRFMLNRYKYLNIIPIPKVSTKTYFKEKDIIPLYLPSNIKMVTLASNDIAVRNKIVVHNLEEYRRTKSTFLLPHIMSPIDLVLDKPNLDLELI